MIKIKSQGGGMAAPNRLVWCGGKRHQTAPNGGIRRQTAVKVTSNFLCLGTVPGRMQGFSHIQMPAVIRELQRPGSSVAEALEDARAQSGAKGVVTGSGKFDQIQVNIGKYR